MTSVTLPAGRVEVGLAVWHYECVAHDLQVGGKQRMHLAWSGSGTDGEGC